MALLLTRESEARSLKEAMVFDKDAEAAARFDCQTRNQINGIGSHSPGTRELDTKIIKGQKPGRLSEDEITLFKSNGLAIQDAATAKLVYDKSVEMGIGKDVGI